MGELPSGTVTFVSIGIADSTGPVHERAEHYAEMLDGHRRALCALFSQHGGFDYTHDDSFFAVFSRASEAVVAARDAQLTFANGPFRVRIGIHTGEPVITDEGYGGLAVHRAARIMDAANAGQTLISETTRKLLESTVKLRDLGEHRLKDLGAPQRLFQLGEGDFPPPRALYRTNLPIQTTSLIGRERELKEAGALIGSHRLLTLTGPGGSGKTRLALQLAAERTEQFPDGTFWVPLQALRDPALVERAIATSVGAADDLVEHISNKRLLVLLDNFEQVIEAATTISGLLASTPNAKVLVTSRQPLHVRAEQRYPVEPLSQDDAVVLFLERARAVDPAFSPTSADAEICRRLDGLPLAIELAAARVPLLEPDELLARLDQRLPLLTSRSPDVPARQRTLHATIEWSYELLVPDEQELFRRLGVFAGSFSVEAAESVCHADLDVLESLIFKSLVRRWDGGRFGMLDTVREYALDRLGETPEAEDLRRRHAEFFLAVAKSANLNSGLVGQGPPRLGIVGREQDNIRAALAWTLRSGTVDLGLELAVAMEQFWILGDPREGMRWFAALLDHPHAETVDASVRGHALRSYGGSTHIAGHPERAEQLCEQSLAIFEELGDEHGRAVLLHRLGIQAMLRSALDRARELVDESHEIHERMGDIWGQAQTVGTLGAIARDAGDEELAFELIERSTSLAVEAGVEWWREGMLAELACLSLNAGRVDDSETYALESLALADRLGDRAGRVFGLGVLAGVAVARGDFDRAGLLWGCVENETAFAPLGGWQHHRKRFAARMREARGSAFEEARAKGRELRLDEAVALALATPESLGDAEKVAPSLRPPAGATASMVKEGEYVTISWDEEVVRLRHSKGIGYLASLLASPSREFHVLELVSSGSSGDARLAQGLELGSDEAGPALDPKAKAAYKKRMEELREDLDEAEFFHDPERASRAREELESLTEQLVSAVGLGGRDRPTGSNAERARVNVTKRIKTVIAKVRTSAPRLGRHLDLTVKTGLFMSYSDRVEPTLSWEIDLKT